MCTVSVTTQWGSICARKRAVWGTNETIVFQWNKWGRRSTRCRALWSVCLASSLSGPWAQPPCSLPSLSVTISWMELLLSAFSTRCRRPPPDSSKNIYKIAPININSHKPLLCKLKSQRFLTFGYFFLLLISFLSDPLIFIIIWS